MATFNAKLIEDYINGQELTKKQFCEMCQISLTTLNKVLTKNAEFRFDTLIKIVKTTKIRADDLLFF